MHPICKKLISVFEIALYQKKQVSFPLGDIHKDRLNTVVKTVYAEYYGTERFPTPQQKACAFFYLIIKDHPLTDGNKRLAVIWLEVFCFENDISLDSEDQTPLDALAVAVERTNLPLDDAIESISQFLLWD